MGFER